jgi:hypothetical protein
LPEKKSVFSLVCTINGRLGESAIKEAVLEQVFETYWPRFERQFNGIISHNPGQAKLPKRDNMQIMGEILTTVRSMDKRLRDIENRGDGEIKDERKAVSSLPHPRKLREMFLELAASDMDKDEIRMEMHDRYPTLSPRSVERMTEEAMELVNRN